MSNEHEQADAQSRRGASDGSAPNWKLMDVVFGDNLHRPRRLILEIHPPTGKGLFERYWRYTTCTESGGIGGLSETSIRTKNEWLNWIDRFADDLTGKELRDAKESVRAEFAEPQCWLDFRKRYAETGDPWIRETPRTQNAGTQPPPG